MRVQHTLMALALMAAPVAAQDFQYGAQVGVSSPQGDAKDFVNSKVGFTVGLDLFWKLQGGHALRPRMDYAAQSATVAGWSNKNITYLLGADYNYFVDDKAAEGFYLLGGLGWATTNLDGRINNHKGAVALAAGLGYQFTPLLGGEFRYVSTRPDFGGAAKYKNDALNLSLTFQF